MALQDDRYTDQLDYQNQVLLEREFTFGGKTFTAEQVVEALLPHVTPTRLDKIEKVAAERTMKVAAVAEHLYDIGNISAVMRSAESYGFLPFRIIERQGSKYKKSDRISRGTEKWLDIRKYKDSISCVKDLKSQGYKVFATDLQATHQLEKIDFSEKVALVFGNEKDGISEDMRREADGTFLIPMYGFAQSFNISVAAAITFSYVHRERVKLFGQSGDLTPSEKTTLVAHYILRTLDSGPEILLAKSSAVKTLQS